MRHNSPTSSESPLFDLQQYVWGRGRNVPEHRKHDTRTHFDPLKKATHFLSLLKTVQSYHPYFGITVRDVRTCTTASNASLAADLKSGRPVVSGASLLGGVGGAVAVAAEAGR